MMRPRPAARNAASRSSAGPAVALDTSAAIGPPYEGRSARGATVSASGPYHVVAESPRFHARNTARYWGVLQRTAENGRSEEHTSELQSRFDLVCRLLLEKKKKKNKS